MAHEANVGVFGARKVHAELNREGVGVGQVLRRPPEPEVRRGRPESAPRRGPALIRGGRAPGPTSPEGAGTAPVTRVFGRSHYVNARKIRNKRLGDAYHWWAFATLTRSPGARAHYDRRRAAGDHHNTALRNLANKLLGRLWWFLQNGQPWDEAAAWLLPEAMPDTAAA